MENNKPKKPLENYVLNAQNSKVQSTEESKLECIAKGVKGAIKSTLNYLKKYVSATPEMGDEGSKYHKNNNGKWI